MLNINTSNRDAGQISTDKEYDPAPQASVNPNSDAQKKKFTSEKQVAANQRNAQRSTGPHDTRGTRYNATKHGFLARGLTPLDDGEEHLKFVRQLTSTFPPRTIIDEFCINQAALEMTRLSRINAMEAQNITSILSRPAASRDVTSGQTAPTLEPILFKEYAASLFDPPNGIIPPA